MSAIGDCCASTPGVASTKQASRLGHRFATLHMLPLIMHGPEPPHCPRPCSLRESHTGGSKGWMVGQKEHDARAPCAPCQRATLRALASASRKRRACVFGVRAKHLAVWAKPQMFGRLGTRPDTTWSRQPRRHRPVVCDTRLELCAHSTYLVRRLARGSLVVEEVLSDDDTYS